MFEHDISIFVQGSIIHHYFFIGVAILVVASFVAGYIDSIAGGAGLVLIPAFILTGLPPQLALGQEKLVSTLGTVAAIKNFVKKKSVIWKIVPAGIISALAGAFIGAQAILILPNEVIAYIIAALLPVGLGIAAVKGKMKGDRGRSGIKSSAITVFFTCFIVGFYDGFFGPGTGSLFIIALCIINNLSMLQASATSKIFNFSSNIGAFVAFFMAGKMAFIIGAPMIAASLAGNHLGSIHAIRTDGKIINKVLSVTVLLMMSALIFKGFIV